MALSTFDPVGDARTTSAPKPLRPPGSAHVLLIKRRSGRERLLFSLLEWRGVSVSWVEFVGPARRRVEAQSFAAVIVAPGFSDRSLAALRRRLREMKRAPPLLLTPGPPARQHDTETALRAYAQQILTALQIAKDAPRPTTPERRFFFGPYCLDEASRDFRRREGTHVPLTTAEFDLLVALVSAPNATNAREQLAALAGFKGPARSERNIDVLICRLRRKLEPDPRDPTYIKTVRSRGYVFAVPVEPKL